MDKRRGIVLLLFLFAGAFAVYDTVREFTLAEDWNAEQTDWELRGQAGLSAAVPLFVLTLLLTVMTI